MDRNTVLIVEDELFVAVDVHMTFEDEGWVVAGSFPRREDALRFLNNRTVDFAILDVVVMDGDIFPVADRLLELGIPFVFHSGRADAGKLAVLYPGTPLLAKPCLPRDLIGHAEALTLPSRLSA